MEDSEASLPVVCRRTLEERPVAEVPPAGWVGDKSGSRELEGPKALAGCRAGPVAFRFFVDSATPG